MSNKLPYAHLKTLFSHKNSNTGGCFLRLSLIVKLNATKNTERLLVFPVLLYYKVLIVRLKVSSTYHTSSSLRVVFSGSESWFLCIL